MPAPCCGALPTCSDGWIASQRPNRFASGLIRLALLSLCTLCTLGHARAAQRFTIACVGDSITRGLGAFAAYPEILQELLGARAQVLNFGVGGRTLLRNGLCDDQRGDCSYWTNGLLNQALASLPDVVVLMLGTNDAKDFNWHGQQTALGSSSFEADYRSLITLFSRLPSSPRVILGIPPPLYPPFPFRMLPDVINRIFPDLIREVAKTSEAEDMVVDLFGALGGSALSMPDRFLDGCHPVAEGNWDAAIEVTRVLDAILALEPRASAGADAMPSLVVFSE